VSARLTEAQWGAQGPYRNTEANYYRASGGVSRRSARRLMRLEQAGLLTFVPGTFQGMAITDAGRAALAEARRG
jgi:hypothetical protein